MISVPTCSLLLVLHDKAVHSPCLMLQLLLCCRHAGPATCKQVAHLQNDKFHTPCPHHSLAPTRFCASSVTYVNLHLRTYADYKAELARLSRELMIVYMELLRVLIDNPANYASPLNTLNLVLANMQYLINGLRPVQVCRARHCSRLGMRTFDAGGATTYCFGAGLVNPILVTKGGRLCG